MPLGLRLKLEASGTLLMRHCFEATCQRISWGVMKRDLGSDGASQPLSS